MCQQGEHVLYMSSESSPLQLMFLRIAAGDVMSSIRAHELTLSYIHPEPRVWCQHMKKKKRLWLFVADELSDPHGQLIKLSHLINALISLQFQSVPYLRPSQSHFFL